MRLQYNRLDYDNCCRRKPNMLALALVVMALGAVFLSGSYYTVWVCF